MGRDDWLELAENLRQEQQRAAAMSSPEGLDLLAASLSPDEPGGG